MSLLMRVIIVITVLFSSIGACSVAQEDGKAIKTRSADAVYLNDEQLFKIKTGSGSYSAKERAAAVNKRLKKLLADPDFDPGKLEI